MTIKLPPLPEPVKFEHDWLGDFVYFYTARQLRKTQREAALMALEEAAAAMIYVHGHQTINNQEFPKAWHEGVAAAYKAIRALRTELEAS